MRLKYTTLAFPFLLIMITNCRADTCSYSNNTWAIKGKVLPWIFISSSGINYSLGLEYGFAKVHSVALDLTYNDESTSHEVYDTVKKNYVSGPRNYSVNRGVMFSYRRYFTTCNSAVLNKVMNRLLGNDYLPYVSTFMRYGKIDYHYETGYVTNKISYDEWHYSVGILFGVITNHIDINIGPFYKQKYISDVTALHGDKVYNASTCANIGLRIGANLHFVLKKKSDHYLAR